MFGVYSEIGLCYTIYYFYLVLIYANRCILGAIINCIVAIQSLDQVNKLILIKDVPACKTLFEICLSIIEDCLGDWYYYISKHVFLEF